MLSSCIFHFATCFKKNQQCFLKFVHVGNIEVTFLHFDCYISVYNETSLIICLAEVNTLFHLVTITNIMITLYGYTMLSGVDIGRHELQSHRAVHLQNYSVLGYCFLNCLYQFTLPPEMYKELSFPYINTWQYQTFQFLLIWWVRQMLAHPCLLPDTPLVHQ